MPRSWQICNSFWTCTETNVCCLDPAFWAGSRIAKNNGPLKVNYVPRKTVCLVLCVWYVLRMSSCPFWEEVLWPLPLRCRHLGCFCGCFDLWRAEERWTSHLKRGCGVSCPPWGRISLGGDRTGIPQPPRDCKASSCRTPVGCPRWPGRKRIKYVISVMFLLTCCKEF